MSQSKSLACMYLLEELKKRHTEIQASIVMADRNPVIPHLCEAHASRLIIANVTDAIETLFHAISESFFCFRLLTSVVMSVGIVFER